MLRLTLLLNALLLSVTDDVPTIYLLKQWNETTDQKIVRCIVTKKSLNSTITLIPTNLSEEIDMKHEDGYQSKNIDNELMTANKWSSRRSNHFKFGIILDSRWESFKIVKVREKISILDDIDQESFQIPFSVLSQADASVYFYDEESKSHVEFIFSSNNITTYCNNICEQKSSVTKGLVFNEWNHFIVDIDNKECVLKQCNIGDCQMVMKIKLSFIPKKMYVSSKNFSLWKIHSYNFTYINNIQSNISVPFPFKKDIRCISMYVKICEKCTVSIKMQNTVNHSLPVERISNTPDWKKFTYKRKMENGTFQFYIQYNKSNADDFLAISSITEAKQCDYRQLYVNYKSNNFTCYAIKYPTRKLKTSMMDNADKSNREDDYFGATTGMCQKVTNTASCEEYRICELDSTNQTCYCPIGYKGQHCKKCEGSYGDDCKHNCGMCISNTCSSTNGDCNPKKCKENFLGSKCNTSMLPVVINAPIITKNGTTGVDIEIDTNQHPSNKRATAYSIQYKETGDESWKNRSKRELPTEKVFNYTLDTLKGDTDYKIRIILFSNDEFYDKDQIPVMDCHTTCRDIRGEDVIINSTNNSATITLQNSDELCASERYEIEFNGTSRKISSYEYTLKPLEPYRPYSFMITGKKQKSSVSKKFTTKEGVPGPVSNIACVKTAADSLQISWDMAMKPNGIISHYIVSYKIWRFKDCPTNETMSTPKYSSTTSNETNWTINDLHPYTEYLLNVFANNNMNGTTSETQRCITEKSDTLTSDELPRDIRPHESENDDKVRISLDKDCTKSRGPTVYNITLACFRSWCKKPMQIKENITTTISPFTEYMVTAISFRKNNQLINVLTFSKNFTTKPRAPHKIEDVEVYSKTNSTFHLRWSPPYPPRGELHEYCVKLNKNELTVPFKNCTIWKQMHCADLEQLNSTEAYNITICAKNKDTKCGPYSTIKSVRLGVEKSLPPENLSTQFDNEYQNLILTWNHPNTTNGPLIGFKISIRNILDNNTVYNATDKMKKENLSYTHRITLGVYSQKVTAVVVAINEAGESHKLVSGEFYTPPKTPTINVTYTSDNNTTVSINIRPSNLDGNSTLYLIVTNKHKTQNARQLSPQLNDIIKRSKVNEGQLSWIEKEDTVIKDNEIIAYKIGNDKSKFSRELNIEKNYIITVFLENKFQNIIKYSFYKIESKDKVFLEDENNGIWWLCLLLLLVPLIIFIVLKNRLNIPFMKRNDVPYISPDNPINNCAASNSFKMTDLQYTKLVRIDDLESYIKEAFKSGELTRQHEILPRGQTKSWDYGKIEQNLKKNRYNNLAAYDHSRVVLSKIKGDKYSGYINANYIDGYQIPKAYIATQGPKPATVKDFWRMIWQENVRYIVMVTNVIEGDKKKTEKYWPDINSNMSFDKIEVVAVFVKVYADYERRVFNVLLNEEQRVVTQLHFVSWPDHGIPLYAETLVPFLQELQHIPLGESPVLVHCSAGDGRTGTIILCDICLRMASNEGQVDVFYYFNKLREQRANMVDNDKQYTLVHIILLNYLTAPETNYSCDNNFNSRVLQLIENKNYISQINHLKNNECQYALMDQDVSEKPLGCPKKDRFPQIIPNTNSRVYIKPYPEGSENSSYINAVKVNGFRAPGKFIVTQQPLPNTLGDFWRLIEENEINLIISLNDTKHKTCCDYWPTEDNTIMLPVPHITLQFTDTIFDDTYNIVTVNLFNENNVQKSIYILQFKYWNHNDPHPATPSHILKLYEEMTRLAKLSTTVLVTCFDGAKASGLFVTLAFLIDKIKLEQECNVCLAVKATRHARREFVQDENQFVYLYRCAMEYLQEFEIYANFS